MIHSLILSDRRNNQYKTLGILIFIIYPILSFPFILKGILKRERWAYLLGAILMGYIGMLYPPAGDMYRYAEDFNLYKELDWEYFWIFMALKFDYFLPLLSWILGKLGAYPESTRFLFVACSYYLLLDLYHDITLSNKDMTRRTRVYSLILLVPLTFSIYLFRMGFAQVVLVYGIYWFLMKNRKKGLFFIIFAVFIHVSYMPFIFIAIASRYKIFNFSYKEFFFSLFYRYLYQINIHKNDFIVVQQNWLREAFSNMYSLDKKKIIVAVPRSANVQIKHKEKEEATSICKFFFPCYPRSFKNIEVICKACEILEKKDNAKYNVLLTLKGNENRYAKLLYKQYSSLKTITFGGLLSYEEVYEKYNKIDCLIFPSKLETWGLPISEFMAFDKPMLIADLPYAHETAAGAKYVAFFNPDTPKMLADRMSEVINGDLFNFSSVPLVNIELPHVTSWKMLFDKLLVDND